MSKQKIRIAVAIDPTGAWACAGWGRDGKVIKDNEMMSFAIESLETGENQYFIEAELDIPEVKIISPESIEQVKF